MGLSDDIQIRISGLAGRITLTRPEALNAMTYDMCMAIGDALSEWESDDAVKLVIIDAEGSRSFCSGGDIADLYATGKAGDYAYGRKFWADEYRINAQIKNYTKPYVAIMDGIVMGGGVGISAHGSHRIVTENTLFAMPECGIGLVPDVGGNQLLAKAPGAIGEYLGTTGARLKAADCITAGIADTFIPEAKLADLIAELEATGDLALIDAYKAEPEPGTLEGDLPMINEFFATGDAIEIIARLEAADTDWAANAAKLMRRNCPVSVACAIEIVRKSRDFAKIEDILALEYRFTYRSMSHGNFVEGVRAQIIDKDRQPKWSPATLEDLAVGQVSDMLTHLGENELTL